MPVKSEIKVEGPSDAELQAIIEEARQRAKRRRLGITGGLLAAAILLVGIIFALNGASGSDDPTPQEGAASASLQSGPEYLYIERITFPRYGNGLLRVDPRTGDTRIVPWGAGCEHVKDCLVSVGGRLVIASPAVARARDAGAEPASPKSEVAPLTALPSSDRQSLWFGVHSHDQPYFGAGHLSGLREISANGDILRTVPAPQSLDRNWPDAAPEGGFVYSHDEILEFWSLDEQRFTDLHIPGQSVGDARGPLVASCSDPCSRYAITNVKTGEITRADPPAGLEFWNRNRGAFAPDLRHIVLPVTPPNDPHLIGDEVISLALVDTKTGTVTKIPRSVSDSSNAPVMTWSRSGDRLYFLGRGYRLMEFTPGSGVKMITNLRVRPRVGLLQMADGPG